MKAAANRLARIATPLALLQERAASRTQRGQHTEAKTSRAVGSQGQMSCSDAVHPRRPPIDTPLHTTPRLLSCKPALHVYAKKRARPDSKQGRPSGRSVTTAWRSATKSVESSPFTLGKGGGGVQAANLRKAPKGETQTRRILPPRCRLSVVVEYKEVDYLIDLRPDPHPLRAGPLPFVAMSEAVPAKRWRLHA